MKVEGDCDQVEMKNIRIPQSLQGLLPVNVQNTDAINILQKLTNGQAPSTCSIENGKQVKTFDNVEYQLNEGQLNNCEHVIFKDCSEDSKVQVPEQLSRLMDRKRKMSPNKIINLEMREKERSRDNSRCLNLLNRNTITILTRTPMLPATRMESMLLCLTSMELLFIVRKTEFKSNLISTC